jgi:hypothetical protein
MTPESLMIFLMCIYVPLGLVMGFFAFVQVLGWLND